MWETHGIIYIDNDMHTLQLEWGNNHQNLHKWSVKWVSFITEAYTRNGFFLNFWRTDGTAYFPKATPRALVSGLVFSVLQACTFKVQK